MKKVFLTFGDGGENFIAARKRIAQEARAAGVFDQVVECDWTDVSEEVALSPLRGIKKGCGCFVWKPDVVYSALSRLEDGDILLYCDCGNVLAKNRRQWEKTFNLLLRVDCVFHRLPSCWLQWNRIELLRHFSPFIRSGMRLCYAMEGNTLLIKKTEFTSMVVEEWRRIMIEHPDWIHDVRNEDERHLQLPSFCESRYDQSVLTMLVYKYLSDPRTARLIGSLREFHFGWWPFGNPSIAIVRNRSGSPYGLSLIKRFERALHRVVWMAEDALVRFGLWPRWCNYGC